MDLNDALVLSQFLVLMLTSNPHSSYIPWEKNVFLAVWESECEILR